ncbi:MAG TPA: redoxin domain-containing protein [Pirellulales bacterium]
MRACCATLGLIASIMFTVQTASAEATSSAGASAPSKSLVGTTIANFTLQDFRGQEHSLAELKDKQAVVVVFLGTECPLARLYGPRLQQLATDFAPRGVAFLGIDANRQDSITELDAYARVHGVTFPLLKDVGNAVADKFGATRTPEVFVLDPQGIVRYHGRIDGQYSFGAGVGYAQPKSDRNDLAEALNELLAGKPISVATTDVKGCLIGRVRQPQGKSDVTYSQQIARIFQNRCQECHREGQIAPFAMTSYDEVAGWGEMIAETVREQRMPPWHANPAHGVFANDARLSDEEKAQIFAWVENGCPEGNPADLPEPKQFAEGWLMPREPDQIVYMTDEAVSIKAEGVEAYRHYVVDPKFTEDKWVKMVECMPGNRQVVHHIIVFVQPPSARPAGLGGRAAGRGGETATEGHANANVSRDEDGGVQRGEGARAAGRRRGRPLADNDISGFGFLAGFAPGTRPVVAPDGVARKIPAGSKLVFQMHYTPCGSEQMDRSAVGLMFMDKKDVTHQMSTTNVSYHQLQIPAGEPNYTVEADKTFTRDTLVMSLFPHMHIRGKSFRYEVTYPDGKHEVLLDVPRYDFNWQNSFILSEPKMIPKGTQLLCTASYDNSSENPFNPDPTKTIAWGPQTWDEMMIGWYDVSFPIAEVEKLLEKQKADEGKANDAADSGAASE